MSLRDEIRTKLNKPESGGWRELVRKNSTALPEVVDLIGTALASGKRIPAKTEAVSQVLMGRQVLEDLDVLLILRSYRES